MLEHRVADLVDRLRELSSRRDLVPLDYPTNGEVSDPSAPLSHAALIRHHLEDRWPVPPDGLKGTRGTAVIRRAAHRAPTPAEPLDGPLRLEGRGLRRRVSGHDTAWASGTEHSHRVR